MKEAREVFLFHLKPRLLQRSLPVVQWSLQTYFQVFADKLAVANFPPSFFSVVLSLGWSGEESLPVLAVSAAKGRFNGNCSHFSDKI